MEDAKDPFKIQLTVNYNNHDSGLQELPLIYEFSKRIENAKGQKEWHSILHYYRWTSKGWIPDVEEIIFQQKNLNS